MLRAQVLYHVTLSAREGSRFFAPLIMSEELLNSVKSRGIEVAPKS
jgi:hypothetical protein